jgi:hypothetical protein
MTFKSLTAAAFGAALLVFSPVAPEASAKTKIIIGVGTPGWCYTHWDPGCHRRGFIYDPYRMTCKEAKWMLMERGYKAVNTKSCGGKYHTFFAKKKGHKLLIKVRAATGRIASVNGF